MVHLFVRLMVNRLTQIMMNCIMHHEEQNLTVTSTRLITYFVRKKEQKDLLDLCVTLMNICVVELQRPWDGHLQKHMHAILSSTVQLSVVTAIIIFPYSSMV